MSETEKRLLAKATKKADARVAQSWISRWITEGPPGFSTLIFIFSCGTIGNGVTLVLQTTEPLKRMMAVYMCIFSLLIIALELTVCCMTTSCKARIEKWARFLSQVWGRSAFFVYVGTVQISLGGFVGIVLGVGLTILGVLGILTSRFTAQKMKKLKRLVRKNNPQSSEDQIKIWFDMHDVDKSGFIDKKELASLTMHLGCPLEGAQLEQAFRSLDKDNNNQISLEEFKSWWASDAIEMA